MSELTITTAGSVQTATSGFDKRRRRIIRVTPTLSTDAYAQGDVLFTATEIPNAVSERGGCSKLVAVYVIDQSDITDSDITLVFSESNEALGTINATANISDADLELLKITGMAFCDADAASSGQYTFDTARVHQVLPLSGTSEDSFPVQLLQAESNSTSAYVQGVLTSATTPTYAADDIDLVFHIEY